MQAGSSTGVPTQTQSLLPVQKTSGECLSINELPKELLAIIFSYAPDDYFALEIVCRDWRDVTRNVDLILQQLAQVTLREEKDFRKINFVALLLIFKRQSSHNDPLITRLIKKSQMMEGEEPSVPQRVGSLSMCINSVASYLEGWHSIDKNKEFQKISSNLSLINAASKGNSYAQLILAIAQASPALEKSGLEKSFDKGRGCADAGYVLANNFHDEREGQQWGNYLLQAAKAGSLLAKKELCLYHTNSRHYVFNIPQESLPPKAELTQDLAEAGDFRFQHRLSISLLREGQFEEAAKWLIKLAEKQSDFQQSSLMQFSEFILGILYETKKITNQQDWLRRSLDLEKNQSYFYAGRQFAIRKTLSENARREWEDIKAEFL